MWKKIKTSLFEKKKVRLLKKKLRQKQKALKEKEKKKKKKTAFTQTDSWNAGACNGAEC